VGGAPAGVRYVPIEALDARDPDTLAPVPWDGESMGEIQAARDGEGGVSGPVSRPGVTKNRTEEGIR
jgi:hypothetical protein